MASMASPVLNPGRMLPGDRRGRVEVVARDRDGTAAITSAVTLTSVPSGTICPHLLRTWSRLMALDPVAVLAVRLDGDLPVAAELVEAVDVERAQVHRSV